MKRIINDDRAFTLIELVVTLAIAGVVSAIAVAGYLSWKPGNVFRGAVSQIQNDLNLAKMRAVETRRQCRVVFTTNGYQIEDGNRVMNSNTWGNVDNAGVHTPAVPFRVENFSNFPQITLLDGTGIAIAAGSEPTMGFSPRGTASPLNTITVRHPTAGSATIAVNITGRINVTWP